MAILPACERSPRLTGLPASLETAMPTDCSPQSLSSARPPYAFFLVLAALIASAPEASSGSELRMTPIVRAVARAKESVVNIHGEKTVSEENQLGSERRVNGMGTGIVIDPRGYILTNYHVVKGVEEIETTLADGSDHIARLVARDPKTDLAVIKIDSSKKLPVVELGTSADLMPGETVIAVGNAYGYTHTVTRGIISALHRNVQVSETQSYEDLIQTDASINPGNSGGPLLNIDGEMIGINVAVRAGAQGIGFAIPVNQALGVADGLLRAEFAKKASLGIKLASADAPGEHVRVGEVVKESPAEESGICPEDEIVRVGQISVKRPLDFHRAVLEKRCGDEVEVEVRRDGRLLKKCVRLAKAKGGFHKWNKAWEVLGVSLEPVPSEEFRRRFTTVYRGGLLIENVRKGSPADERGLQKGDILVGLHVWETVSMDNIDYILNHSDLADLDPLKVYILREGNTLYSYLPMSSKPTNVR